MPIAGALIIAAGLLPKPAVPPSPGAIRLDSATFGVLLLVVIGILGALLFFPALALGPLTEQLAAH